MRGRIIFFFCILSVLIPGAVTAQEFDRNKLQGLIDNAVQKAYASSVKMWGFDTVRKVQNSAQFSAVVVSPEGRIITVAHAISPNRVYKVLFPDGKECLAIALGRIALKGTSNLPDVGMLQIIDKGTWPYAEMGWSSSLKIDEPCISIAYPESLGQSLPFVRWGRITRKVDRWGFLHSTCVMEVGDSGGPLFDLSGRVIGLHSRADTSEEVNYEVPIDTIRTYWTALGLANDYRTTPETKDAIGTDPMVDKIISIPELADLPVQFGDVDTKYNKYCIQLTSKMEGTDQKILGTVISLNGIYSGPTYNNVSLVLSKSSMIGEQPEILLAGEKKLQATVVARDKENDLVLLRVETKINDGISLNEIDPGNNQPGRILISPFATEKAEISVLGSKPFHLLPRFNSGYLGTTLSLREGKNVLTRVQANSPASEALLSPRDEILYINETPVTNPGDFSGELQKHWPGEMVTVKGKNATGDFAKEIILGQRPAMTGTHVTEFFEGGKSFRRDGFKQVFIHDARIKPEECGGPVIGTDGYFYGLNIARFSRTTCVSIPKDILISFIKETLN